MILFIAGIIKFLIGLVGVLTTLVFLSLSLFKRTRRGKLKTAGITFFTTVATILIITAFEFLIYPPNRNKDKLVLTAFREAPLGAYWLGLYDDSTWELGNSSREIKVKGTFTINGDTLNFKTLGGTAFYNGDTKKRFLIQENDLIEIENTGIGGLKIGLNKINKNGLNNGEHEEPL